MANLQISRVPRSFCRNARFLFDCYHQDVTVQRRLSSVLPGLCPVVQKRAFSVSLPSFEKKSSPADDGFKELDKPIQFTTSKAAEWKATDSLSGRPFPNAPSWQPEVVVISVGAFLLYFLALREENDFDEEMGKSLWERIPGLEKQQLQLVLDYNRAHDLDTVDIENRLKELESQGDVRNKVQSVGAK